MPTAAAEHTIENALDSVRHDSLEQQVARWFRFAGSPPWLELQALKIRVDAGAWERSKYAHADDVKTAARLAAVADKWLAPAVYVIANGIADGVSTRATPGHWHDAKKGESTSDADIAARTVLFIDVDARRPKGISATDEEIAHTADVARSIYEELAAILEDTRLLGYGDSGNGRSVFMALDSLDVDDAGKRHHAILVALGEKYSGPHVEIDQSVHDAKRLVPCFGTLKKKGAPDIAERPHRRTAFTCEEDVARVSLDDLDRIVASLRVGLPD
jgi:hypothetical protein